MGIITVFLQMGKWRQESLVCSRLPGCFGEELGLAHRPVPPQGPRQDRCVGNYKPGCLSGPFMEHNEKVWHPGPLPRPTDLKHGMGTMTSTDTSVTGSPDGHQLEAASLLGKHLHSTPALCSPTPEGLSLSATVHGVPTTVAQRLLSAFHAHSLFNLTKPREAGTNDHPPVQTRDRRPREFNTPRSPRKHERQDLNLQRAFNPASGSQTSLAARIPYTTY